MSGDRRYEEIFAENKNGKGKVKNMCDVAERLVNKGRAESIERLLRKGKSPEEIHDLLDYPMEDILRVEREISAVK
jgi:predicted transposase YdaD